MAQEITLNRVMQAMDTVAVASELQQTWNRAGCPGVGDGLHRYFPAYHKRRGVDGKRETLDSMRK